MLPEAAGQGQHFQAQGHSFSLYGLTLSRPITFLSFSSCLELQLILQVGLFMQLSHSIGLRAIYKPFAKNLTSERASKSDTIDERCIKEQIYFELLYVSAFSSLIKVPV